MAKKAATARERAHMDAVAAIGCLICRRIGTYSPALIHHVRSINGQRITRNHMLVIPICWRHHSADSPDGFHHGSKPWQAAHGTEAELLEEVRTILLREAS